MKRLITVLVLFSSVSVLASVRNLEGEQRELVREALIDSVNRAELRCSFEGAARPSDRMMKPVIIQILNNESAQIIADESDIRPRMIVKRPTNYRDLNYIEMNFNTTFDMERVEFIELYEARIHQERQNVGTIFNPRFELVDVHTHVLSGRCNL